MFAAEKKEMFGFRFQFEIHAMSLCQSLAWRSTSAENKMEIVSIQIVSILVSEMVGERTQRR